MNYRQKQEIKEDMIVSKSSPRGESVLQLPFPILFKDTTYINHGEVSVNKIKPERIDATCYYSSLF